MATWLEKWRELDDLTRYDSFGGATRQWYVAISLWTWRVHVTFGNKDNNLFGAFMCVSCYIIIMRLHIWHQSIFNCPKKVHTGESSANDMIKVDRKHSSNIMAITGLLNQWGESTQGNIKKGQKCRI